MTAKEILENIKYFTVSILRNAFFDNDWDRTSLQNAIQWAKYCEKIYHKSQGKSFSKQLDNYMKSLVTVAVIPVLNFEILKNSTNILFMALLQNPYLSRDLVSMILQENYADENLKDNLCDIVQLKSSFLILEEWIKLKPNINSLVVADLSMECLINKFSISKDITQKQKLIGSFFNLTLNSKNGLLSLIEILTMPSSTLDIKDIQIMLMNLLLVKINPKESEYDANIAAVLWNQKPVILSKLSKFHLPFYKIYCNYLIQCAENLELNYTSNGCQWILRENQGYLNYDDLLIHFKLLWNVCDEIQEHTFKLLSELSAGAICSIWEDIIIEIN